MGKVGKVIVGVALIVTGAVVGVFTGQWTLAFALASSGVGLLTQPRMPKMGDLTGAQGAILENRAGALQALPVCYGNVKIGGVVADIRVDTASTERKRLVLTPAFCHGSRDGSGITSISELWFNDAKAVDGSTLQTPYDKAVDGQKGIRYLEFGYHLGKFSGGLGTLGRDSFGRTDSATTMGTAEVGGAWTAGAGSTFGLQSGQAYVPSGTGNFPAYLPCGTDGTITCNIKISPTAGRANVGLVFRHVDDNHYLLLSLSTVSGVNPIRFYKNNAGFASLAESATPTLTPGTTYALTVTIAGPVLTAFLNGIQYLTYTLSAPEQVQFASAINAGLWIGKDASNDDGGSRWDDFLFVQGTTADNVDARLNQMFPVEWPVTSKGQGIVYARLELWYSNDIYAGGIPNVQVVIKGNRVYDPRDVTWKFSTNPALCIRDYMASAIYGLGIPEEKLDDQSFIDMANHCDEIVSVPGGGSQKRYELNGWVDTSRSVTQNLADLCTSCRGQVVNEGDRWRMVIRRIRQVSGFHISGANTLEGSWQFILPGSESSPNVARASYIDPSQNYDVNAVQWPEPGQANTYLTEDSGFEQRVEIDLPYTQNVYTAQQILMTLLKESRKSIGCVCTLREEALQCRIGDLVEVTHNTPGWTNKIFDVGALLLGPDASVQAVLVEYDPNSYNLDVQFVQPNPPSKDLPNPFTLAPPSSLVLVSQDQAQAQNDGGYVPRIRATWVKSDDPFVDYYEVHARPLVSTNVAEGLSSFGPGAFSHSGMGGFTAANVWNDNFSDNAFNTDSAVAGAWVRIDCGTSGGADITKEFIECRLYTLAGGNAANFTVQYSDNNSSWTSASVQFVPSANGLNSIGWASVGAHRYWRILLNNTPGAGPDFAELQFKEPAWDNFGRVAGQDAPLMYVYPVTISQWQVRIRAVNKIGVTSSWISATHLVVVPDPRPQILSITLTNAHSDTHSDIPHQDVAHGDSAHVDTHTDGAHTDHTDHGDSHGDSGTHGDVAHNDSHTDNGQFIGHVDSHGDSAHSDHSDGHADTHTDTDHLDTAHVDAHTDTNLINPHGDDHTDLAHTDHTDSGISHTDVAHVDSHTDTAHSDAAHNDAHTDAHSDGQYGVGIAIQADNDSASVKAVARKVTLNKVANPGGEIGTVGSQATSWTANSGNGLLVANDFFKSGSKSMKIINGSAVDSNSYQDFAVVAGKRYRVEGWIKTTALPTADAGVGAVLNVEIQSGITSWTIVEKSAYDPAGAWAGLPDIGVAADGAVHDWTYVYARLIPLASGTMRLFCQLGYGGGQSGTAWFDEVGVYEDEPIAADVRLQPAKDGRNVSIELIDAATGAQIQLAPGDMVRVGALAYSLSGAAGVEGPLAMASLGLFNVAPVGTNLWVPS